MPDDDDDHEQFDEGEALLALGAAIQRVAYALHNEPSFFSEAFAAHPTVAAVKRSCSVVIPYGDALAHITNAFKRSYFEIVCMTNHIPSNV